MKQLIILLFITLVIFPLSTLATTWDEPWQDKVIKEADYFVYAKVKSFNKNKGVTIKVIKSLGGQKLKDVIKITDFYLLDLCSSSDGHGPEFHFQNVKEGYFFIKKNKEGNFCIATPTSGFAYFKDNNVFATYRHSYHKVPVPADIYEKTMTAIFNYYHNQPYDKDFVIDYANKNLALNPAGLGENEIKTFIAQHVALECAYHLRLTNLYSKILPFLADTSNYHNQISGARALVSYNTTECKQVLLKVICDSTSKGFAKVMCIWTLAEFKPSELKDKLIILKKTASTEESGFGGSIMDPRVCTDIPDVKAALEKLIETL